MIILGLLVAVLVGADQLVKYWAVHELKPVGTMDFIRIGDFRIFDLTYLENDGAIFGSMSGQRWVLIGFTSLVVVAGIVVLFKVHRRSKFLSTAIALFIAGGIGNLIDRFRYAYVVDMFEFKPFKFAIFNVADICVTFAFIMLIWYALFIDQKIEKAKKAAAEAEASVSEKADENE